MLERQLNRVENIALDVGETSDVVPGDARNLGRANALRVRAPRLLEGVVEVDGGEGDSCVLEILQSGGRGEGEDSIGSRCTSSTNEIDEVVGDESGRLNGESAEGDVGSDNGGGGQGAKDGETLGFSRSLESEVRQLWASD